MNDLVPADLRDRDKVLDVVNEIKPSDLDDYERLQRLKNKTFKLRTLLRAWERQQTQERELRSRYAKWLLGGLFAQMLLVDATFVALGLHWLVVERWVATSFILAVLADIGAMATIVIKYLFRESSSEIITLIGKTE